MSENKQQFETDIVINEKPQGTVARHLRFCGIFNDNLLQIHCWAWLWKNFKISQHLAKLIFIGQKADCLTRSVCLGTVLLSHVPQTPETISAASGPKFTILWAYVEEILLLNKFFFRVSIHALVAKI